MKCAGPQLRLQARWIDPNRGSGKGLPQELRWRKRDFSTTKRSRSFLKLEFPSGRYGDLILSADHLVVGRAVAMTQRLSLILSPVLRRLNPSLTDGLPLAEVCYRMATGLHVLNSSFTVRDPKRMFACARLRSGVSGEARGPGEFRLQRVIRPCRSVRGTPLLARQQCARLFSGNCPIRVDSRFCRAHPYRDKSPHCD